MNRQSILLAGGVLCAISVVGLAHALRTGAAQALYFKAKYGSLQGNREAVLRAAGRANRLYPENYYLCTLAAETAYDAALGASAAEAPRFWSLAERWCNQGLVLNGYRREPRLLKARLLARASPARALAYWEQFVGWHFWDPFNHAVLAELASQAGDFQKAISELRWVKGSEYYEGTRLRIEEAWQRESTPPTAHAP